ncbi:MAG: sensor histidine kinase [Lachnospiraceae bacterium]|nr:sensor histidine kinase [Lachnospiraceae bacterium]
MKNRIKSLRFRIILIVMCFSSAIALLVALLSFYASRRYLRESIRQSAYINVQLLGNEINYDLNLVLSFIGRLTLDPEIEDYLNRIDGFEDNDIVSYRQKATDTWAHLNEEYTVTPSHDLINRFLVSTPDGSNYLHIMRVIGTSGPEAINDLISAPFFSILLKDPGHPCSGLYNSPFQKAGTPILPLIRPVKNYNTPEMTGFIYAEISSDVITKHIDNLELPKDSSIFITFGDNNTLLYENGAFRPASLPSDKADILAVYTLPDKDITLCMLPSESELRSRSRNQFLAILLVLLFIFITGVIVYFMLSRMINAPVEKLTGKLNRVGEGDFTRDNSIEWDNELGNIGKGINDLSVRVEALINDRVKMEKDRQELEYRMLQSQINPHFMYNTLNTIKWMATIQGADGIADMSTSLSRLLKNVSKSTGSLISLKEEKALLDDYYTIMKYRYGGTIDLSYDIDNEELLGQDVNRFCLQPIVENAIFHGIEPKGSAGKIRIHIYDRLEDRFFIDVTDNGIGMDEQTIEKIMNGDDKDANDFFTDIGVYNVDKRIKLTFGNEYGLTISSIPGESTTVHYTFPKGNEIKRL